MTSPNDTRSLVARLAHSQWAVAGAVRRLAERAGHNAMVNELDRHRDEFDAIAAAAREAETGQDALTNAMVDVAADAARGIGLSTSPSPADDVETVRRYDDPDLREVRMREEMAKVRADAIENAARVCEFRARSLAEDSHDYWASNEASKCAVAIRWLITNPTRFVALSGQEGK